MSSLDMFKKRMSDTSGSSMRDEIIKNSKQLLQSTFLDDASANPYITFWNTETKLICRIWGRKKSSGLVIATIQTFIDSTVTVGDILYDSHDKQYWMCTNLFNVDDVHKQGELTLCNYTLKFQSPDGTILSYPCIDETNSSMGLDVNNTITVPNSIHTIKLPFDENTTTLREDRRLFISRDTTKPRSFKITKVNDTEFAYGDKGIIEFTLEQTVGDYPKDRIDLGICDYFEPTITPTPSPTGQTMTILSSGTLLAGGLKRTFTPKLVDSNGVEQNFTAVWTFNYNGMPTSDFVITYDGNKCMISVAEDYDIIDNALILTCTSDDGLYGVSYNAVISA